MLSDEDRRILRWEYLRRNERFQKDFRALEKILGMAPEAFDRSHHRIWLALYSQSEADVRRDFPGVNLQQVKEGFVEIGRFREKWGLSTLQGPERREPPEWLHEPASARKAVEIIEPAPAINDTDAALLSVRLDLRAPTSQILRHVEDLITLQKKLYAERQFGALRAPRLAEFETGLRLYDEVVVGKARLEDVAERLFSVSNADDATRKRAREHAQELLKKTRHLVEEGFSEE